jgi:hypothetical protein
LTVACQYKVVGVNGDNFVSCDHIARNNTGDFVATFSHKSGARMCTAKDAD